MVDRLRTACLGFAAGGVLVLGAAAVCAENPPQGADRAVPAPSVGAQAAPAEEHDPLLDAMRQELTRAQQSLRLPDQPVPYFISFWIQESSSQNLVVRNGALVRYDPSAPAQRIASVQVRVGGYQFDNSQLSIEDQYEYGALGDLLTDEGGIMALAPIQEDARATRATLWLAVDAAYKRALVDFHKKKARQALTAEPDPVPDFSQEEPSRYLGVRPAAPSDFSAWRDRLTRVTQALIALPELQDAWGSLRVAQQVNYYINTEGTQIREPRLFYTLALGVSTQAPNGTPLENFKTHLTQDPADLPDESGLLAEAQTMAQELIQLRSAEEFLPYTGPAILDGEVAGVFFHEALGHRLEGERQRRPDEGQTFRGKIGQRILPDFLTVIDDPTLERFDGHALAGFYHYDNEGIPAQRTVLVEQGILKNYLMSRKPVKGFVKSNGHGRAQQPDPIRQPVGRMGNLIVQSTRQKPWPELKQLLLEEAKRQDRPYGLIIRRARSGETDTVADSGQTAGGFQAWKNQPVLVYRVDVKTGEEQLVRGVELVGTPLNSLERVIASGDVTAVFNGSCGAESGMVPVSTVAPALLTTQVELQRIATKPHRLPILPSPFHEPAPDTAKPSTP